MREQHNRIDLDFSAGSITFDENPTDFTIARTVTGINITVPALIDLEWPDRGKPQPMLTNLRATISIRTPSGAMMEVGTARDEDYYTGSIPSSNSTGELIWANALPGLIFIEKNRLDKKPQLELLVRGELCFIVKCAEYTGVEDYATGRREGYTDPNEVKVRDVRTVPYRHIRERVTVSYPIDIWERMIKTALDLSKGDQYLMLLPLAPFLTGGSE